MALDLVMIMSAKASHDWSQLTGITLQLHEPVKPANLSRYTVSLSNGPIYRRGFSVLMLTKIFLMRRREFKQFHTLNNIPTKSSYPFQTPASWYSTCFQSFSCSWLESWLASWLRFPIGKTTVENDAWKTTTSCTPTARLMIYITGAWSIWTSSSVSMISAQRSSQKS